MDASSIMSDLEKWLRKKNTVMGIVGVIVIVLVLYADFSYWANTIEAQALTHEGEDDDEANVTVPSNYTYVSERALEASGTTPRGSPTGVIYVDETFELKDNGFRLWVNLSGDADFPLRDYDLQVLDPAGKDIGSSGNFLIVKLLPFKLMSSPKTILNLDPSDRCTSIIGWV